MLPETHHTDDQATVHSHPDLDEEHHSTEQTPLLIDGNLNAEDEQDNFGYFQHSPQASSFQMNLSTVRLKFANEYQDFSKTFTTNRNVALCLVVFLVTTLAKSNLNILLQYVSKRYGWTIAQAAYLFSVKAGVNIVLYALLIPVGLHYLTSTWQYTKTTASVFGAKTSLMLLCIGATSIALSTEIWMLVASEFTTLYCMALLKFAGLVVYALGWAVNLFMLSLLTHTSFEALDDKHIGWIYSAVGLVETLTQLAGAPLLCATWVADTNTGSIGLGSLFSFGLCYTSGPGSPCGSSDFDGSASIVERKGACFYISRR